MTSKVGESKMALQKLVLLIIFFTSSSKTEIPIPIDGLCRDPENPTPNYSAPNSAACGAFCKAHEGCAAFFHNKSDKKCLPRSVYEANFLAIDFDKNFDLYHCMRTKVGDEEVQAFHKIPDWLNANVSFYAAERGYTHTVTLQGGMAKKHIQILDEPLPFWKAERLCAERYGTIFMEYNTEATDAILEALSPNAPQVRHLAVRPIFGQARWQDGRVESTTSTPCNKFSAWTGGNFSQVKSYIEDGEYHSGARTDTEMPSKTACEFFGKNLVASAAKMIPQSVRYSVSFAHDNKWVTWGEYVRAIFQTYEGGRAWLAVDFGSTHLVRMFRFSTKASGLGYWINKPKVYVGSQTIVSQPVDIQDLLDKHYLVCGQFPSKMNTAGGDIVGITCPCLLKGRYGVLQNQATPLHVTEIAIYGMETTENDACTT